MLCTKFTVNVNSLLVISARFIVISCTAFIVFNAVDTYEATAANGWRYIQRKAGTQLFQPITGWRRRHYPIITLRRDPIIRLRRDPIVKLKRYPIIRLKNDNRSFTLHVLPSDHSRIVAHLRPPTRYVELLNRCTKRFCYVRLGNVIGWLRRDRIFESLANLITTMPSIIEFADPESDGLGRSDNLGHEVNIALPVQKHSIPPMRSAVSKKDRFEVVDIALPVRKSPFTPNKSVVIRNDNSKVSVDPIEVVDIALPVRKGLFLPRPIPSSSTPVAVTSPRAEEKVSHIEKKKYALKNMGARLFLPIRKNHTESSPIMGTIPFFATNVEALGLCIDDWCLIRRGYLQGWIKKRYLSDTPLNVEARLQLEPIMPVDELNVYSAPHKEAKIVTTIKAPATDIKPQETCNEQWCYISYSNNFGWVEPHFLTRQ